MVGLCISSYVEKCAADRVLKYRQPAQITVPSQFKHAMDTDVGWAFVEGKFRTLDPVSYEHLDGKHFMIHADYQKYTRHTRIEHYTTGSGEHKHHHTRVVHYWTWDTYDTKKVRAKEVEFCGNKFSSYDFKYWHVPRDSKIYDNGYHKRIVFTYWPTTYDATICTELKEGKVKDWPQLHYQRKIPQVYEDMTTTHDTMYFWILYGIISLFLLAGFVYAENEWLED